MYDIINYEEALSVREALEKLQANPNARLIAGGTDLLIKIRQGKLSGVDLIGIQRIPELSRISLEPDGTIVIGAGATFSKITGNPVIQEYIPVLVQAVGSVGGPQIRNVGTIGGNLCNGATSADSAATLFSLNALLKIQGASGTRVIPIENFYLGPGKVALKHDEILTAILLFPDNYRGFGGCYIKYAQRNAMDIAMIGCAALCKVSSDGISEDLRLAFGAAAPIPMRCPQTETLARGRIFGKELLEEIGESCVSEVNPRTSWRASREYRLHLVKELSKRAFHNAFINAGGEVS